MDDQGEDCIAVGSTGTLLSLMGKEMEMLQARRSCSVSNYNYKRSPSAKDPNTLYYASNIFGSPASPLKNFSPSSASIIMSSLWSDLKGLLRSPTSIHHSPLHIYHNNAHIPLIYHNKELEINVDSGAFCSKSPSQASPLRALHSHDHTSPAKLAYPKKGVANSLAPTQITGPPSSSSQGIYPKEGSAAALDSCSNQKPSRDTYPKEKVSTEAIFYSKQKSSLADHVCSEKKADYLHGKSALHNHPKERLAAGAAPYPNRKSPLHYHSQERSSAMSNAYANRNDTDITPTGTDQETRKSLAAANPNFYCRKGKASNYPNLLYPKAKAMDAVYAMRRRLGSMYSDADSQNGKLLQEEVSMQDEYCMQKRSEERGNEHTCMQKSEERECMQDAYPNMQRREEGGSCMQELYECCMQKPMLPCTPSSPCFKPSRSFGGRSLPLVSVVDLQCCHTPTSRERSSSRLTFSRLSSF